MDKYIYDDKNGLWYELQGDYYIPCLILPAEKEQPIGLRLVTALPTDSTTPTISCPTVIPGTARGTEPCLMCRSLEQMLASVTLTMASLASCSAGFGFSTS